jgi:mRNA interferase MazF
VAYRFGDVLLVPISFSDATGGKKRPVLVVHDIDDVDLLVVPITSHPARGIQDVPLNDWQAAGLRLPSWARMSKLATVAKSTVIRKLGQLREHDAQRTREGLRGFFDEIS